MLEGICLGEMSRYRAAHNQWVLSRVNCRHTQKFLINDMLCVRSVFKFQMETEPGSLKINNSPLFLWNVVQPSIVCPSVDNIMYHVVTHHLHTYLSSYINNSLRPALSATYGPWASPSLAVACSALACKLSALTQCQLLWSGALLKFSCCEKRCRNR